MRASAWRKLSACLPPPQTTPWLETMLRRNLDCAYLKRWGQPLSREEYRRQVPLIDYDELRPWIERIAAGEASVLFAEQPVAFEQTGGSSGGSKLIPYTQEGLLDFRRALLPWLAEVAARHQLAGSAYFSISPACRKQEYFANAPVGLGDTAYLGETAGAAFAEISAVPPSLGDLVDIDEWRAQTLEYLRQARDLELISAWSPTFLLRLFDGEATETLWPNLKVISCWTSGSSAEFIAALQRMFPQAVIEPKGLMSTEAAVTVPDEMGQPVLCDAGFFEFRSGDEVLLEKALQPEHTYEVVVTTAGGLYRYCSGDMVRFEGRNHVGRPILQFIGRQGLVSDLAGEKLTESFVSHCLQDIAGFKMLVPTSAGDGYMLVVDRSMSGLTVEAIERRLMHNPQYAYARKLGQLKPLELLQVVAPWSRYERFQSQQGVRLGDIKPVALRGERHWVNLFGEQA